MHRDTGLILLGLVLAIIFGALLMNYGRESKPVSTVPTPAGVSFALLEEGSYSGKITERVNYRIRTEPEFASLWNMMHEGDDVPVPVVDFDAHDVLAVFEGERPSAGYAISIMSVETTEAGELKVTLLHEEPGATCLTSQVITSPFELVVVPKIDAQITREDVLFVQECE